MLQSSALSDTMDKRITQKANYSKEQKTKLETFWSKGNMGAEISVDEPILSERGNGSLFLIEKRGIPPAKS